ncbi:hypothetical protein AAY473_037071 [Plecturocebus cupreus]
MEKISWVWWHTPTVPATQVAEVGESLEPTQDIKTAVSYDGITALQPRWQRTWMNLETIIFSKLLQEQKIKHRMFSLIASQSAGIIGVSHRAQRGKVLKMNFTNLRALNRLLVETEFEPTIVIGCYADAPQVQVKEPSAQRKSKSYNSWILHIMPPLASDPSVCNIILYLQASAASVPLPLCCNSNFPSHK